jgi:hypothetical protein
VGRKLSGYRESIDYGKKECPYLDAKIYFADYKRIQLCENLAIAASQRNARLLAFA